MKKYVTLFFFSLLSTGLLLAQIDPKYAEGTVPVIDGKVSFTAEMKTGSMTKEQIYQTLLEWANNRFQTTDKFKARVLYSNIEEGNMAIGGDEYIVFSSSAISLDRSRIYYQLFIYCENGLCKINMTRIRYWYQEERDGGEKYNAEEWITDEYTLNKSKTKLYPISGKFRRKTIDLKEDLFKDIQSTLGNKMIELGIQSAPVPPESKVAMSQPQVPQSSKSVVIETSLEQPVQSNPEKTTTKIQDEETLIRQATRMTVTAGNDEQFEISKDCWGGFGELFGKRVAFCLIDTQKTMGNMLMTQSENYKISFYSANNTHPVVVILCKKLMAQNITGEEAKKMNSNCTVEKSYNMYVGEILK